MEFIGYESVLLYVSIPPLPQYALMARCSVKAQGQIYLYLIRNTQVRLLVRPCEYFNSVSFSFDLSNLEVYRRNVRSLTTH